MDDESRRECPMCASRNVSFSAREHALVCRDCGTVIAGKALRVDLPREESIEIVHEAPSKLSLKLKRQLEEKKKSVKKAAKKISKKAKKVVKKKVVKKSKPKKAKKSLMKRFLRRR